MLGHLMNSPFVVGACYVVVMLVFALSALFDIRGRRENQFPDCSSAYLDDPELPIEFIAEDDEPLTVPSRFPDFNESDSNAGAGPAGSGIAA